MATDVRGARGERNWYCVVARSASPDVCCSRGLERHGRTVGALPRHRPDRARTRLLAGSGAARHVRSTGVERRRILRMSASRTAGRRPTMAGGPPPSGSRDFARLGTKALMTVFRADGAKQKGIPVMNSRTWQLASRPVRWSCSRPANESNRKRRRPAPMRHPKPPLRRRQKPR